MHVTRRYREEIVYPTPKAQAPGVNDVVLRMD
jgi:hypothetical protein